MHCDVTARLDGLLAGTLGEAEERELQEHAENCPPCSSRLAELAKANPLGPSTGWPEAPQPPVLDAAGIEALERLKESPPPLEPSFPGEPTPEAPLGHLGRFQILAELGKGSYGYVYKAWDPSLERHVALKVLRPELAPTPEAVARFQREARAAAKGKHRNVVEIHDFLPAVDEFPFHSFVMEFVEGQALDARLEQHRVLSPREGVNLARQVALGLAAAHNHGFVHRDVKPANLLIETGSGEVKITDFGLVGVGGKGNLGDRVLGTPAYMSPEQFTDPGNVGPASDLYNLGAVLYQMVTGHLPFPSGSLEDCAKSRNTDPPSPSKWNPKVYGDLDFVIRKCLAKDPKGRHEDAGALAADLDRLLRHEPIPGYHYGPLEWVALWHRRGPLRAVLIWLLFVAVLSLLFFLCQARQAREAAEAALTGEKAARRQTNVSLYFQAIRRAHAEYRNKRLDLMRVALEEAPADLRRWEWNHLDRLCSGQAIPLHQGPVDHVAVSADGRFLALAEKDGVRVLDCEGLRERATWQKGPYRRLVFQDTTPRLALLTFSKDVPPEVFLWDFLENREILHLPGERKGKLAFAADGRWVATGTEGGDLHISDAVTGKLLRTLLHGKATITDLVFSPDSQRLASAGGDRTVCVWSVKTGELITRYTGHEWAVSCLAFHPEGQWVASASVHVPGDQPPDPANAIIDLRRNNCLDVRVWDSCTGAELLRLPDAAVNPGPVSERPGGLAFSRDGRRLAVGGHGRTVSVWELEPRRRTANLVADRVCPTAVMTMAFGPGNSLVTAGSKGAFLWDLGQTTDPIIRRGSPQDVFKRLAVRGDGDLLATGGRAGAIHLHDANGRICHRWKAHGGFVFALAFSPDRRILASAGRDESVNLWSVAPDGKAAPPERSFHLPRDPGGRNDVRCIAFSPDGRFLAAARTDGPVRVWDLDSTAKEPRWVLVGLEEAAVVTFHPSGRYLAAGGVEGSLHLWEIPPVSAGDRAEPRRIHNLRCTGEAVECLAFNRAGDILAVGNGSTVRLFEWVSGKKVGECAGHDGLVTGLSFHPDGDRLASSSNDKHVRIWDTATWEEVLDLADHPGAVTDLAFGVAGGKLISVGWHETLVIWDGTVRQQ